MKLKNSKIYIFGAHSRSITFGVYMRSLFPETEILAYLYDNDETNPSDVDSVPVFCLKKSVRLDTSCPVYLATRGVYHARISCLLKDKGFNDIIPVTPEMDTELRNRYVEESFGEKGRSFIKVYEPEDIGNDKSTACVYVARSAADAILKTPFEQACYEKFIQAGTALSDRRIEGCRVFDNEGDNISDRNRQFCELTAMYWLWKHAEENIIGLVHYRRHFILPKNWTVLFEKKSADVILPVPLFVDPSLRGNYIARHTATVWDVMMETIRERHPDIYAPAVDFFENNGFYSPCNMVIARREIFDEMCEFIFPIIMCVADKIGSIDDNYQNRYPGFLSERLISFFFFLNENRCKIFYADKTFLA